jgi:hypothetical protein
VDEFFQPEVELVGSLYHVLTRLAEECRDAPFGGPAPRHPAAARRRPGALRVRARGRGFPVQPPRALWDIRRALGPKDVLISDVGLHKLWIGRMFPAHEPNTVMIANGLAGMGFAVPCAIAAKLVHPDRRVVTVNGDGGFLMNVQELETAVRLRTPIVNVVWENHQYGSIVWKQDKKFGRHFGVGLHQPGLREARRGVRDAGRGAAPRRRLLGPPAARADARRPVAHRPADRLLHRRGDLRRAGGRDGLGLDASAPPGPSKVAGMATLASSEAAVVDKVHTGLYIGGQWRDATGGGTLPVEDPATGETLAEVADATVEDAQAALASAHETFATWKHTPPRDRAEILRRAFELVMGRADELALLMTLEMGKPVKESRAEIAYAANFLRWNSEEAVRISGRYGHNEAGAGRVLTMQQPVGPCLFITPWNFPMAMGTRKIGPAVAAGCTMVVKPAKQTPLSMLALARSSRRPGCRPAC